VKKVIYVFLLTCGYTLSLFAQNGQSSDKPVWRQVSGVIEDAVDTVNKISYATVTLHSAQDSLKLSTDTAGRFSFRKVRAATFDLHIHYMGYRDTILHYAYDDTIRQIAIGHLPLHIDINELDQVDIDGTPAIIFKTDTTEFNAGKYEVPPNSGVDKLVEQMDGFIVERDGTVTYNGKPVRHLKLNGRDYLDGEVANAIQSLPADIVDKIQLIDDYGEEAALTGIKEGEPNQVLNIYTRTDRSVGNMLNVEAGTGKNGRYDGKITGTQINRNKQIGIRGNFGKLINGIGGWGSPGSTTNTGGSMSYRNNLGKKINLGGSYSYSGTNTHMTDSSTSQHFSTNGTTYATNESASENKNFNHNGSANFDYRIDSLNTLRASTNVNWSTRASANQSNRSQRGLINQDNVGEDADKGSSPRINGSLMYSHRFKKPRRSFSISVNMSHSEQNSERTQDRNLIYLDTMGTVLKDSLVQRLMTRENLNQTYRFSATYIEPIDSTQQLELRGEYNYRGYDNRATTANTDDHGALMPIDSLNNIFNYAFQEMSLAVNYRYNKRDFSLSVGAEVMPTVLTGYKSTVSAPTHRRNLNILPILRLQRTWSRRTRLSLNYSGRASEPSFDQIQPVRDVSNPQHPIIGNPNLKPTFNHAINLDFNTYNDSARLSLSGGLRADIITNRIVRNVVQVEDLYNSLRNETHFENVNGSYNLSMNHNISKRLKDRRSNISLNGSVRFAHEVALDNNLTNESKNWNLNERVHASIRTGQWLTVNSDVSFSYNTYANSLPTSLDTRTTRIALSADGEVHFTPSAQLTLKTSKNYMSSIPDRQNRNPLIIDVYFRKIFLKRRNATCYVQVFDLLNQNKFVNRQISSNSIVDRKTNTNSRYFVFTLSYRLQKWSGASNRNGHPIHRRGDGSFAEY